MATNFDDVMNKHFENAGVPKDDSENTNTTEDNTSGNEAQEGEAQDTSAESGEGKENKEGDQQPNEPGDRSGSGKDGKPQQQSKPEGKGKEGKDGAAGGKRVNAEADRWRDQYQVERQRGADLNNQLKQMRESRDTARNRLTEMERTVQSIQGAAPRDVAVGVQIVRDMQRDPVGTLRKLLTEAVAAGHTVEGIGQGVDTAAITRLIESRMPQPSAGNDTNNDQAIANEIGQFYGQYPDARVHDETLARVLNDHPQLSLTEAMFELKSEFAKRGLDWSKAINDPGNMARLNPSSGQDNKPQQQREQKPLPNGRQGTQAQPADHVAVAHETTSTDDIVKAAMRESGMSI